MKRVAILITTCNQKDMLNACLTSLKEKTKYDNWTFEQLYNECKRRKFF